MRKHLLILLFPVSLFSQQTGIGGGWYFNGDVNIPSGSSYKINNVAIPTTPIDTASLSNRINNNLDKGDTIPSKVLTKTNISTLGYTAGANGGIAKMEASSTTVSTSIPTPLGSTDRWYPTNLSTINGTGLTVVTAKGAIVPTVAGVYFTMFKVDVTGAGASGLIQIFKGGSALSIFGTFQSTATTTATCAGIGFVTCAAGDSLFLKTTGNGTAATGYNFQWLIFKFSN